MSKFSYFRHSVNARNDDKLKEFGSLLGRKSKEGYFYFFTLIELCASQSDDGQTEFKIHQNTLRTLWETNAKGVQVMCKLLTSCALVMCKPCANHVVFSIPNLPIYLGLYDVKKRKEKERKTKEIKEEINKEISVIEHSETKSPPPQKNVVEGFFEKNVTEIEEQPASHLAINILTALNSICFSNHRPNKINLGHINARLKEGYVFQDFVDVINFKAKEWLNDPKMGQYLRPKTLFCTNFDGYLQAARIKHTSAKFERHPNKAITHHEIKPLSEKTIQILKEAGHL